MTTPAEFDAKMLRRILDEVYVLATDTHFTDGERGTRLAGMELRLEGALRGWHIGEGR